MRQQVLISLLSTICFLTINFQAFTQGQPIDYFVPTTQFIKTNIQSPEDFFGFPLGKWHLNHEQVYYYLSYLANASDRIEWKETGRSYEGKPMFLLKISSPGNIRNLENIRTAHLEDLRGENRDDNLPAIVWQGFGVHGNEQSATHAAVVAAWYMAASDDREVEQWLENIVMIMEPCLNPDGHNRFAAWVNANRSFNSTGNTASRELNEPWPRSRTNHYWFDLNRDWMPVQHPESRSRIPHFHQWKPSIVTDFHEMGSNATYFFQPGVPERVNPFIPESNQQMTAEIAKFHAQALDDIGSLYYTKESFDDYYAGKGSTYPDLNGGIGILFEQASSRGHLQQTIHGPMDFAYTIRNQVATTFSTMRAAHHLKADLRNYQRTFFEEVQDQLRQSSAKGYVIEKPADPHRWHYFLDLMLTHGIEVFELNNDMSADGRTYTAGNAALVPLDQMQYRFIKSMFDRPVSFRDSIFYDLSTWNMPDAFHLNFSAATRPLQTLRQGNRITATALPDGAVIGGETNYAYALPWTYFHAPGALYALQNMGIKAKVATRAFEAIPARTQMQFEPGTIIIPVQPNLSHWTPQSLHAQILAVAQAHHLNFYALSTGLSISGIDLGSPNVSSIDKPNIALITGGGVHPNEIGEIWHLLDQRHSIAATLIDVDHVGRSNLSDFNVIIMADGSYSFPERTMEDLKVWVRNGGTLILQKRAVQWAIGADLIRASYKSGQPDNTPTGTYADIFPDRARNIVGGAIFTVDADLTNPLMFGMDFTPFPVHRGTNAFMELAGNPYANVARHGDSPYSSGYVSDENKALISHSAYISAHAQGRGRIICFADNPNLRGYWFGTSRLTMNAIFMSQIMTGLSLERGE